MEIDLSVMEVIQIKSYQDFESLIKSKIVCNEGIIQFKIPFDLFDSIKDLVIKSGNLNYTKLKFQEYPHLKIRLNRKSDNFNKNIVLNYKDFKKGNKCGKTCYSKVEAQTLLNNSFSKKDKHKRACRIYHCLQCNTWHLTKQDNNESNKWN